jgi:hypothetical protein
MAVERKSDFRPEDRWLIAAMLLSSSGWVLHLTVSYALVPESCGDRTKIMLHVVTAVCMAIIVVAAGIAWRVRSKSASERTHWVATMIFGLALGFALVVIAQEIPNLILRSCD